MSMFEKASRLKIRFETRKGSLTVEDLWDLPLKSDTKPSLDDIAISLNRQIRESETLSFVDKDQRPDETLQVSFEVVKHVIAVRLQEREERNRASASREQKEKIMSIIQNKENEALSSKSVEELRAILDAI